MEGIFCCVHPKLAAIHRKTAAPSSGRYEPHLHLHLIREYSSSSREKKRKIFGILMKDADLGPIVKEARRPVAPSRAIEKKQRQMEESHRPTSGVEDGPMAECGV